MVKTNIIINTQFPALHCWPGCDIHGMEYLRNPHRHVFYVRLKMEVMHDDRDVEFINFKKQVDKELQEKYYNKDLGHTSCEMLCDAFLGKWNRVSYVRVMEDNENGSEKYKE